MPRPRGYVMSAESRAQIGATCRAKFRDLDFHARFMEAVRNRDVSPWDDMLDRTLIAARALGLPWRAITPLVGIGEKACLRRLRELADADVGAGA